MQSLERWQPVIPGLPVRRIASTALTFVSALFGELLDVVALKAEPFTVPVLDEAIFHDGLFPLTAALNAIIRATKVRQSAMALGRRLLAPTLAHIA
jgi:hypothetical protein